MAGIFDRIAGAASERHAGQEVEAEASDDVSEDQRLSARLDPLSHEQRTPQRVREVVQEVLKYGLLEESHKPNLYRSAISNSELVLNALEPLDLAIGVDDVRGLVFVIVKRDEEVDQDEWSHPLVRRQRLNLEQSLLVAILRQQFIAYEQESGAGAIQALMAVDELIPQLQVYLGELGSEAKERNRILTLLDQLKGHGLVSAPDSHDRVAIRPIITHLVNPENLQALVAWMREQAGVATGGEEDLV